MQINICIEWIDAGPIRTEPAARRVSVQSDPTDPLRVGSGPPGAAPGHLDHGYDLPRRPAGAGPVQRRADRSPLRPAERAGRAGDQADRVLRVYTRRSRGDGRLPATTRSGGHDREGGATPR